MRKDVKLGLAIGAIFLAVVIVYAAVPRHAAKKTTVVLKTTESASSPTETGSTPPHEAVPAPAPDQSHSLTPAPAPAGDDRTVADRTSPGTPPERNAVEWSPALFSANESQLHAMIGHPHAPETPVADAHPQSTADLPGDVDDTETHHGGAMADDVLTHPTTGPASSMNSGARTHTIQAGETLASIAKSVYGKSSMYLAIEKANPALNPNRLKVGTILTLPTAATASSETDSTGSTSARHAGHSMSTGGTPVDSTTQYRVQPGDSLHKIAVRLYGNANRADELYTTNREVIGEDPARLKVGEILKLPEPPTATAARTD